MTVVDQIDDRPLPAPASSSSCDSGAFDRKLAHRLGRARYSLWFDGSTHLSRTGSALCIAVPTRTHADKINAEFRAAITDTALETWGDALDPLTLTIEVRPELFSSAPAASSTLHTPHLGAPAQSSAAPAPAPSSRRPAPGPAGASSALDARHSLDRYVVGESNRIAHAAALRLAESAADAGRADSALDRLFIHGGCGLGKTHLLQGICLRYLALRPDAAVRYYTGEEFTNQYIAAVRANRLEIFRRTIRRLELLIVDDVHFLSNKQATQQEFLATFDAINLSGSKLVLASDEHPTRLPAFHDRLVSRCLAGLVVEVHRPDRAMRREIVLRRAAERGLVLQDAAVDAIVQAAPASIREIEGALSRVEAFALLQKRQGPIGMLIASPALGPRDVRPRRSPRVALIAEVVCRRLCCSVEELRGDGRHKVVVLARSLTAYLARAMTNHSFPEIARAMGRANHSTIIAAAQRIEQALARGESVMPALSSHSQPALSLSDLIDHLRLEVQQQM